MIYGTTWKTNIYFLTDKTYENKKKYFFLSFYSPRSKKIDAPNTRDIDILF